ncbi:MAG: alpha/beta hydrolase family protein [Saprospiraceae bacterium]
MKLHTLCLFLFLGFQAFSATVDTMVVFSVSMNKSIQNIVILPDNDGDANKRYPVVYLLHGATGDYTDWIKKVPAIVDYADEHQFIIVCPDGGNTSWYFDSPIDPSMQYETYISKELVSKVDSQYPTLATPEKRAITGLSMGGHGALFLCFRNQDIWLAAGSMSGGVDIRPFPNNWDIKARLGTYAAHPERWETHSVTNLLYLLNGKSLSLIIDCGVDDFFYQVNAKLHDKMVERNIPHDYIERPGKHNWDYWENAVKYQLLFFDDFFAGEE